MSRILTSILFMVLLAGMVVGQSISGSISGIVKDSTGSVIAGAKVSVIDSSTNDTQTTITNSEGLFVFPQLQPTTYTIRVEKDGFKQTIKTDMILSAQSKLTAGELILEVGRVNEAVTVTADSGQLQLQTESGERSDVITNNQLKSLALNGRSTLELLKILPGVSGEFDGSLSQSQGQLLGFNVNGTRSNTKELTIDGATNIDSGNNGAIHVTVNPDAIAEVKVLTSNFQAEFGKAGGANITIITKGGGNTFHGGGRYFRRHDSLNANPFFNNSSTPYLPRPIYRYNYYGWDFNGPVWIPKFGTGNETFWKGKDKLFFSFNQEYYDQLSPGDISTTSLRVPTLAERNGDFSQTVDGLGNKVWIRNPQIALTNTVRCEATPKTPLAGVNYQGACFANNQIPSNLFWNNGQAILNIYPKPIIDGINQFNYVFQGSNKYPRREDNLRVDYIINNSNRLSTRYSQNADEQSRPFGGTFLSGQNVPLTNIQQNAPGGNLSAGLSTTISSTLINEAKFGFSHGRIHVLGNDTITRAASGLTFDQLYPEANPGDIIPNMNFGGIASQAYPSTGYILPFKVDKYLYNFSDSISWLRGSHTFKAGIFIQRSVNNNQPQVNPNGNISFANNTNHPLNTGHPYANALLGIYNSYSQSHIYPKYQYVFNNIEWYLQDTYRVNRKLTLDYGLRMANYQPQYNSRGVGSSFNPELYDKSKAMRLYVPVCLTAAACLSGANRRAVDPSQLVSGFVPKIDNTLPSNYIGALVPGSGDPTNGLGLEKNGYPRAGYESAAVLYAPRFGFAYALNNRTVLRGGFGASFDRLQGNVAFGLGTNPPNILSTTYNNGTFNDKLDALVKPTTPPVGPSTVVGYSPDGNVPTIYSFSLGVQREIGHGMMVDISYVGTQGRHLSQRRNINAIPYHTTFQKWSQDKTLFANSVVPDKESNLYKAYSDAGFNYSGGNSLTSNFLRPYQGYGPINYNEFVGTSNYNSLQASVNRRFSAGIAFGASYTWSKAFSTADGDTANSHPFDTRKYDYKLTDFDRSHVFVTNYVWDVPAFKNKFASNKFMNALVNGWQLSGILRYQSGTPYQLGVGIAGLATGTRITGSPDLGTSFYLKDDPSAGKDGLLINSDAFIIPRVGQIDPWPNRYLRRPSFWDNDMSLFKNIYFSENKKTYLQLRLEAFNVFNSTRFRDVNGSITVTSSTGTTSEADIFNDYSNATIRANIRKPTDTLRIGNYFGEPSGARNPRIIQLAAKFYF